MAKSDYVETRFGWRVDRVRISGQNGVPWLLGIDLRKDGVCSCLMCIYGHRVKAKVMLRPRVWVAQWLGRDVW